MKMRLTPLLAAIATLLAAPLAHAGDPANPILFVTQVPMPEEVNSRQITHSHCSCVSPFANQLGGTAFAGRGGSLWVRFGPNANATLNHQLFNLLAVADWSAIPGGKPAANTVAVRNPSVHWGATKAIFSMVIGAPVNGSDLTEFHWQLYEITLPTQAQLNANVKPVITNVPNQPDYNNIMPCYTPDNQIVFSSDRPYNGQAHLTQREEYLALPTVTGLWKLNPANAASLKLLHHSPSGSFSANVDSAGRLIFTNWDHLSRDIEAVTDERDSDASYGEPAPDTFGGWHATGNGSGNFADESAGAVFTAGVPWGSGPHLDFFPEPRNADKKTLAEEWNNTINGVTTNIFLPWMINLDGTNGEILNHVGVQEVAGAERRSFKTDNNLVDFNPNVAPGYGGLTVHNFFSNLMWTREDPLNPGVFYGIDCADMGTHGAGQIIKLGNAGAGVNPDTMTVTYFTGGASGGPKPQGIPLVKPGMNEMQSPIPPNSTPETVYRTPVPLADANLVASAASGITQTDYNTGTVTQPVSFFAFRLKSFKPQGSYYVPDVTLTPGLTITSSYYVPGQAQPVMFTNVAAWELDPAEVVSRNLPNIATSSIDPIEAAAFVTAGVHLPTFTNWLVSKNYALSISRDVRFRDQHDRQQPFNVRNVWSGQQIVAVPGTIYNVGWVQFLQADLRRGYTFGGANPVSGRRVMATPLHDSMADNIPAPGAPAGSLKLGDDSSFAAIVPAGKALTWHLLDNDAGKTSQIKERFWVTMQPGEIRTCANCHGINTANQIGTGRPTNTPQALLDLLAFWKSNHPPGAMQHVSAASSAQKSSGTALLTVGRTGGSTGPVSVDFATANGTATAGIDYTATNGTLSWADGDVTPKTISVSLLNNPAIGPDKTVGVTLSNPQYGSLGAITVDTLTITESAFDAWRYTHFGGNANTPGIGLPGDDPDGDGQNNQSEFISATTPVDPASVFQATVVPNGAGPIVQFDAEANLSYTVQYTDSIVNPQWQKLGDVTAVGYRRAGMQVSDTQPANTHRYYRVVTPMLP
jgi:hypothetical protein